MLLSEIAARVQRRGEFSGKACGAQAVRIDTCDLHSGAGQQLGTAQGTLFEHEVRTRLCADRGSDREFVIQPRRLEVVDRELRDHELQSSLLREPHLLDAERAQPFGAAPLEELEKV